MGAFLTQLQYCASTKCPNLLGRSQKKRKTTLFHNESTLPPSRGYVVFAIYSTVWIEKVLCYIVISQSFHMFQCKFEGHEFKKNCAGIPNFVTTR